ncbi:MAG TPA: Sec-independent protein translocase subunit TatA [Streptosporangiaceae bacterium]|jgi:sec-independent protein translocase protein TatA|nr:Sec-independent protein translocase subunit TatA [Streptosporangiaceae bacterium]
MIGGLFDSPWKTLIIALVIIVLFGSKKLPSAARSLGQSMRILKKEVHGLHEDEPEWRPPGAPAAVQAPAEITVGAQGGQVAPQAQIDALQQQIRDLQRAAATDAAPKAPAAAGAEASRPVRQPV